MRTALCALLCFLATAASGQADYSLLLLLNPPTAAAGGPDVWYDVEPNATANSEDGGSGTRLNWAAITPAQSGTCTKLRVFATNMTAAVDVKMTLYNNDGTVISGATGTVSSLTDGSSAYLEVTLGTPASVTGSTTYKIAYIASNNNLTTRYLNGSGSFSFNNTTFLAYGSQPETPLPTDAGPITRSIAIGMYVD